MLLFLPPQLAANYKKNYSNPPTINMLCPLYFSRNGSQRFRVVYLGYMDNYICAAHPTAPSAMTASTNSTTVTHLLPPLLTNKPLSGTDCFTPHRSFIRPAITVPCEPDTYAKQPRHIGEHSVGETDNISHCFSLKPCHERAGYSGPRHFRLTGLVKSGIPRHRYPVCVRIQ